jgi:hypothetical protein
MCCVLLIFVDGHGGARKLPRTKRTALKREIWCSVTTDMHTIGRDRCVMSSLLRPIAAAAGQELLKGDYIQADETPVDVQYTWPNGAVAAHD